MKHYKKHKNNSNYKDFTKYQPCWTCSNFGGRCSWTSCGKPVEGWQAVKTYIPDNVGFEESYKIMYCPEYREEV